MSPLWLLLIVPAAMLVGRAWQTIRTRDPWTAGFREGYDIGRRIALDVVAVDELEVDPRAES